MSNESTYFEKKIVRKRVHVFRNSNLILPGATRGFRNTRFEIVVFPHF